MKTPIHKSYQYQNGCHNCVNHFIKTDYDDGPYYFCHQDKSNRPKCGSCAMDETFNLFEEKKWVKEFRLWDKWSTPREVKYSGICDLWELLK